MALTKNGIRGFAAGILIATAVFAFFYYLIFNDGQSSTQKAVKQTPLTEATVTQYLTSHHRRAIDIDAYNQWQADNSKAAAKTGQTAQKANNTNSKPNAKPGTNNVVTYQLNIKSGMMPSDISSSLVQAKILNSNQQTAFDQYMHTKHLENYVQLGTFTVKSNMSIQQLAQVITKNH
ncbi:hypothetical protein [Sporolactobacillus pectinivorans]|uniref:hypothetical protein n=1 Tax=Sporolactobacillus pectinivorans TaxID=1591408 RepID=UPI001EFD6C0D|nr:hypothetical protein [Sporolactobacillus pectinivorans]